MKTVTHDLIWPPLIILTVFFASGQSEIAAPSFSFSLDKVAHFGVFGALATSIVRLPLFRYSGWKGAVSVCLMVGLYGALDEYRQSFTPGRVVEFDDWIADFFGAFVAVVLYQGWTGYQRVLEWRPLKRSQKASNH